MAWASPPCMRFAPPAVSSASAWSSTWSSTATTPRATANYGASWSARSIQLSARGPHFLLGERAVLPEEGGELLGRVADRLETEVAEVLLPELGGVHDPGRFGGEPGDHVARRAGRRGQPEVERGVEIRKAGRGER